MRDNKNRMRKVTSPDRGMGKYVLSGGRAATFGRNISSLGRGTISSYKRDVVRRRVLLGAGLTANPHQMQRISGRRRGRGSVMRRYALGEDR